MTRVHPSVADTRFALSPETTTAGRYAVFGDEFGNLIEGPQPSNATNYVTKVSSVAELKAIPDPIDSQVAYLTEPGKTGIFIFRAGDRSAFATLDPRQGVFVTSDHVASNVGLWIRPAGTEDRILDVRWFGAALDNSTDDTAAFQAAINLAESFTDTPYNPRAEVFCPPGKIFKTTSQINLRIPIKLNIQSLNFYHNASGTAWFFHEVQPTNQNNYWDVFMEGTRAAVSPAGPFPSSQNISGSIGIAIRAMTFSRFECKQIQGFTNIGLQLDGRGLTYSTQVIQHTEFHLGQIVNNGIGIWAFSLDAATSSVQANRFYIQNIYQNWTNILTGNTTYRATTSNTWDINAMDNCTAVGIDSYSIYDTFYIGFAGEPGTTLRRNAGSDYNKYEFNNNFSTDIVVNEAGGGDHDELRCKPSNNLPQTGVNVVNGSNNLNGFGIPINVHIPTSGSGTFQLYLVSPSGIETHTPDAFASSGILSIYVKPGWSWKVFTTSGTVSYGTATIFHA